MMREKEEEKRHKPKPQCRVTGRTRESVGINSFFTKANQHVRNDDKENNKLQFRLGLNCKDNNTHKEHRSNMKKIQKVTAMTIQKAFLDVYPLF